MDVVNRLRRAGEHEHWSSQKEKLVILFI